MKKALKISATLLAITLILSSLPIFSFAAEQTSGDLTWSIEDTVLTISGNGATDNYTVYNVAPWSKEITKVIIQEGVTKIGDRAFAGCQALESVQMAQSVQEIGREAFTGCISLQTIELSNNVTAIGKGAFAMSGLTEITLPKTLSVLNDETFFCCMDLNTVNLNNGLISIGNDVFNECVSLSELSFCATLEEIGEYAFWECSSLSAITLPKTIKKIGKYCFRDSVLDNVYYMGSLDLLSEIDIDQKNDTLLAAQWHFESCINSASHDFDNDCDAICNICDFTRTTTHSYSSHCDSICNVCKEERDNTLAHTYDDHLDLLCDLCEFERVVESIEITALPNTLEYNLGQDVLSVTGGKIKITYSDQSFCETDILTDMVSGFNNKVPGKQTLTVTFYEKEAEFEIEIIGKTGDVNADGLVNTTDLAILKQLVAGLIAEDADNVINPDIDLSGGKANTTDLALLKKIIAGLE